MDRLNAPILEKKSERLRKIENALRWLLHFSRLQGDVYPQSNLLTTINGINLPFEFFKREICFKVCMKWHLLYYRSHFAF